MRVFCAYDAIVPIIDLVPHPKNPNRHPESQIEILAKIIQENGWRAPITVSKRSGYIVRGHGRLMAAIHAGMDECPVDYQDYESEERELQDLLADNRVAELADMDETALGKVLEELQVSGADIDLTGFDESAIDMIFSDEFVDMDQEEAGSKESSVPKITVNGMSWNISEDEADMFQDRMLAWIDETGLPFGFIRSLLDD